MIKNVDGWPKGEGISFKHIHFLDDIFFSAGSLPMQINGLKDIQILLW
jgi:hypothetical protein